MTAKMLATCAAVALAALTARAADESGPKAGAKVPALKVFGVVGTVEGKEADFAAARKDAPTIYLFVQAEERGIPVGGRPLAQFMRELDKQIGDTADKAEIVAVWLGEKAFDKHKEYLPKFQMSLNLKKTSLTAFGRRHRAGRTTGPSTRTFT